MSLQTVSVFSSHGSYLFDFCRKTLRSAVPIGLMAMVLVVSPEARAAEHGMKFDPDTDFSTFTTYEWVAAKPKSPAGSPLSLGAEADTLIRNAIDRELSERGFRQAIDEEPDFLVAFDGALEPVTDFEGQRRQLAKGVAWVIEGDITSYQRGTLVITITNPKTKKQVWNAWTTDKVKNPDKPRKQIDKTVKKMLRRFPPGKGSKKK